APPRRILRTMSQPDEIELLTKLVSYAVDADA
ncbi:MAG: hypothetical protein QOE06_1174, partial [Thermoleophilaceae bacterium]|nr:hypothetical protein [Thermoleophilaceae bacterium]